MALSVSDLKLLLAALFRKPASEVELSATRMATTFVGWAQTYLVPRDETSATPTANTIPIADGTGKLNSGWLSGGGGGAGYTLVDDETPSGTIDDSNTAFSLAHTPSPSSGLMLFLNGVLQLQGVDYTLTSATVTMTQAPASGDWLRAYYRY